MIGVCFFVGLVAGGRKVSLIACSREERSIYPQYNHENRLLAIKEKENEAYC